MLENINMAIANYERRLGDALTNAADPETMPGAGLISLLNNDLNALILMRRDAEQREALSRKLEEIDASQHTDIQGK